METIYCLVPETYWAGYADKGEYVSRTYEAEGFIHATKGDELLVKVANRVYPEFAEGLLVLEIDESKIKAKLLYEEASDGLMYPHIYGPLNTDAIVAVRRMTRETGFWQLGERL
ncbi:UNVERIFIED_CONTAM: uncharacterized protein (DUF952 family) [Brevibacillus sp. OAP136]